MKCLMQLPVALRSGSVMAGVLASCLWLAGCAGALGFAGAGDSTHPFRDPGLSMQAAMQAVATGTSNQQDVMAALGPATVVRFDSGYEVWVYRKNPLRSEPANAEFVILFDPSGHVKKLRFRPAYAPKGS